MLRDFRDNVSTQAKISPLVGLVAEGPTRENFIAEGGEGLKAAERVDFKLARNGQPDQLRVGARGTLSQFLSYDIILGAEFESNT